MVIDRLEHEIQFNRNALNLRNYRQDLLASNIANADTPHFKAKDIDFKGALANVMAGKTDGSIELARTNAAHIEGSAGGAFDSLSKYRAEYQGSVDGNTVNIDVERSAFTENSVNMEALLSFLKDQFKEMTTAITGQ